MPDKAYIHKLGHRKICKVLVKSRNMSKYALITLGVRKGLSVDECSDLKNLGIILRLSMDKCERKYGPVLPKTYIGSIQETRKVAMTRKDLLLLRDNSINSY